MKPTNRKPTSPGEILLEELLKPMNIRTKAFSILINWDYKRLKDIIYSHESLTEQECTDLGRFFTTTKDFWMNLNKNWSENESKT